MNIRAIDTNTNKNAESFADFSGGILLKLNSKYINGAEIKTTEPTNRIGYNNDIGEKEGSK